MDFCSSIIILLQWYISKFYADYAFAICLLTDMSVLCTGLPQ
jgi:hypothetical protein